MTNSNGLSTRAVLVSLSISTWAARKFDRKTTEKTNIEAGAAIGAGRYNKHLLAGAAEHKSLIKLAASARVDHYKQTLPWSDEGWRLLPTQNYMQYQEAMRSWHAQFEVYLNGFLDSYPMLREAAREQLGDLYVPTDYPSVGDIRSKFSWTVHYSPIPDTSDIRVELGEEHMNEIQTSISNRLADSTQAAVTDAWERLYTSVKHVHERLSEPDNIFRNSLIGNIEELSDLLTRLNITNDPNLEAMRQRVERELALLEPEDLRKDQELRQDTAKQAEEIMKSMAGFYRPEDN